MNIKYPSCTDALFAQPSLISGVARVLDLGGTFDEYASDSSPDVADARALGGDWTVVGLDMEAAMRSAK